MSSYLTKAEEVGEVETYPLLFVCLVCQRFYLPLHPHLYRDLSYVGLNAQPLDPLEGEVQPGEVVSKHVVVFSGGGIHRPLARWVVAWLSVIFHRQSSRSG